MTPLEVVLIVVAHTDDETLGAAGSIANHVAKGDKVYAVSMTDGVGARDKTSKVEAKERNSAAKKAAKILGFTWVKMGQFPDNALDTVPLLSLCQFIESAKKEVRPTIIYTHSAADLNIDHRKVCEATLVAFRPQPDEIWKEIRCFEIPSATDFGHAEVTGVFTPNLFVSIEKNWQLKQKALKEYRVELREFPHSRSLRGIENLANLRGNQCGLAKAEAFQVVRKIER